MALAQDLPWRDLRPKANMNEQVILDLGSPLGEDYWAAMQLAGTAGDMQIPNAELTGVFNMGGSGVANYASILEKLN